MVVTTIAAAIRGMDGNIRDHAPADKFRADKIPYEVSPLGVGQLVRQG
jgi:hypothetical protein